MVIRLFSILLLSVCIVLSAAAQEPQFPSPQKEHEWLRQFEGTWTTTSQTSELPDVPTIEAGGKMNSRMLGGFWVLNEIKAEIGGSDSSAVQTIGYNAAKKKYVGTWVDSMTDHLWHYEGTVDESGNKLALVAEGPNHMAGGKITKFRDSYEFKSPDLVISTAEIMNDDGEWEVFMTGEMRRE